MNMPLYKEIYESLRNDINNGVYPPGEKLPSDNELVNKFNVSKITITTAMNQLKEEGIISRAPRRGSYVLQENKPTFFTDKKRKPKIGLIVPNFNDLFGADFLQSFTSLAQDDFQISFYLSNSRQELEDKLIQELLEEDIEGLVLIPSFSNTVSSTILKLISKKFPIIVVDRSLSDLPVCSVMTNNTKSSEQLTEILLQNGHSNLAMITTKKPLSSISERRDGFIRAHMQASRPVTKESIFSLEYKTSIENHIQEIKKYIKKHPEITGLVCEEYYIAYCVKEAAKEMKRSIPDDLSVVCFDHPSTFYQNHTFFLTHIKQNETKLAEETFKLLKYKLTNPDSFKKVLVDGDIIEGNSVKKRETNY